MVVHMNHVSWRREDKWILKDVSWKIKQGEHWCLFGLNGSGKTTLLNIINGYIWPTEGEVTVLGKKFGQFDLRELRKEIGWVSSSLQEKFSGRETALDIVLSGKFATIGLFDGIDGKDIEKAKFVMSQLDCDSLSKQSYRTLSHGEKQRVLIARALMASPKLLILDEPCTGLDLIAREQLLSQIGKLAMEEVAPTLIYVTHHVEEILPCFEQALLLKNGQVFSSGKTALQFSTVILSDFFEIAVSVDNRNNRFRISLEG